ncbi:MAG: D-tyrosyl-tRNA(Tyr) deacylase [Firmicutes bacterium HGW-Firmicutes-1]|jgi:D-tyrosyl-tRNA(Tyr) deacylase|nr:MAG: D-tyrosyl-tRNA(Tyr) deacylase [Firmicutes bacterium HGW-Firmicutes-1]
MRSVVQRVSMGQVVVDGKLIANIGKGIVALVGFQAGDSEKEFLFVLDKLINLRIFEDLEDKMNLSIQDINGELLVIPNFTLYGDCRNGRRPSYSNAAKPNDARILFQTFCETVRSCFPKVQFGEFQADMKVSLLNDGPVTLLIDSDKRF